MEIKLKFKADTQLEVIESFDVVNETVESIDEIFKKDEIIEAELVSHLDSIYEVQFGDGSVAYIEESNVEIID